MKKTFIFFLLLIVTGLLVAQTTVTIGAGTSTQRYPLGGYFGYERSAGLYLNSEINSVTNKSITKLAWYCTAVLPSNLPVKIYLKTTTATTLTANTWANYIAGANLVYEGTITSITANAWNEFILAYPFDYTGTNLMVMLETNFTGSGNSSSTAPAVRYSSQTGRHMYVQADTNPPTGNGTITANLPNIQITYADPVAIAPNPAIASSPANASINIAVASTLNWVSGGNFPTGYRLWFGTDNPPTNIVNGTDMGLVTTYDPTPDLNNGATYYWKVEAYNTNGNAATNLWSFTTLPPPLVGTKTIDPAGSGENNYTTFAAAINTINTAGIGEGGVTFNVKDGSEFVEDLPVITATGTATSSIIFQRDNSGATRPVIKPTSATAGIQILGGDYITFDGIDITVATGSTPNYGYSIRGAAATNGAQYNTIKNCKITLNKANTSTKGIYQYYNITPTATSGANSYNKYQNVAIENSATGFYVYGVSSTYPDVNTEVSGCTIGGANQDDMGGSVTSYGMYLYYQNGTSIFNNEIRNFGTSSSYSIYGIYTPSSYMFGTNNIYNNKIHDIRSTYVSSSYYVYGIYFGLGSTGTNVAKIYNNMIWNLSGANPSSASSTFTTYGIYNPGATSTNTYNIDFNTVRITGPVNASSTCYYNAAITAVNKTRNNIFANQTPAQSGTSKHYCYYSSSATSIGATGSISNNNVLYLASESNGYVGRGSSTDYQTLTSWQNAMVGHDTASRPTNPQFVSDSSVYIQTGVATPVEAKASYFSGANLIDWVPNDIDGARTARNATTPDIGADEGDFTLEVNATTPSAQPTTLVLIPASTSIDGSFAAADPAAEAYLVVRYTTVPPTAPVDGTSYSVGSTLGDATAVVVKTGSSLSFSTASLTVSSTYNFNVYSYNSTGLGAPKYLTTLPLTGSIQTLPAAPLNPAAFTATPVSDVQINLAATQNAAGSNILVAWNSTATFGTPLSTADYVAGNAITGGGTILYIGPASGLTPHTGLTQLTAYNYKAWSYDVSGAYEVYSTGMTATATTQMTPISTFPYVEDFGSTGATYPPAGWSRYTGVLANPSTLTTTTSGWIKDDWGNVVTVPPNNATRMEIYSTSRYYWVVSPPINIPDTNYKLMCDIALTDWNNSNPITSDPNGTTGVDDRFIILIGDGTSWTPVNALREWNNSGSPYVYNSVPSTGSSVFLPLTGQSGVRYLAFYGESTVSNADNDFFVDNVRVFTGTYEDLAVTNLTSTPLYKFTETPFTFDFTVTNYGEESNGKSVIIKENGTQIGTVSVGTLANGASVNLSFEYTPLVAGTYNYTAEVPVDNVTGNNTATLSNVTVYQLGQLAEGFEDVTFAPSRWLNWGDPLYTSWEQSTSAGNQYDGTKNAFLNIADTANTFANLATPKLMFAEGSTFSFYAKSSVANLQIQMQISDGDLPTATWTDFDDPISLTTSYALYSYTVPTGGLTGNYRVAFNGLPNGLTGTIYLDKVIGPMIYNPPEPPGPVTLISPANEAENVNPLTFILDWTAPDTGGTPNDYYVLVTTNVDEFYDQVTKNVFPATEWQPNSGVTPTILAFNTRYFWTVLPGNGAGYLDVGDCPIYEFRTKSQMTAPEILALGNAFPTVEKTGTIAIINDGDTALTFDASGDDFTFGARFSIPANSTYNLPFTFTVPTTLGAYTGLITLTETSPGNSEVTIAVTANISTDVIVGTGTSELNIPVDPYFGYSYSQTIYYPGELNWPTGYVIDKINYYFNGNEVCESTQNFIMYMGHTANSTFASTTSWVPLANLTQVYNQVNTPQQIAGGYWMEFILDTPFIYDGTNNLVIAVEENLTGYDLTTSFFHSTITTGINRSIRYTSDSTNPDPASPPTGVLVAGYPNTKFVLGEDTSAHLEGYVYVAGTTPPVPISGATVNLASERLTTTTDANGFYSFTFWADGTYTATVSKISYYSTTQTGIAVTMHNTTTQNFYLTPMPRVSVSGTILGNDVPGGIEGAEVALLGSENQYTLTGPGGAFTFSNVLGSSTGEAYSLTVDYTGYESYSGAVTVYETNLPVPAITLNEITYPAYRAVATETGNDVQITWDPAGIPPWYYNDFEVDNGGWVPSSNWSNPLGDWEWANTYDVTNFVHGGSSASEIPPTLAHSGTGLWGTKLYAPYSFAGGFSYLRQTFDLTNFTGTTLRFWSWNNSYGSFDYARISVNGTILYGPTTSNGSNPSWQEISVNLAAYDGLDNVVISFEHYATTVVSYAGWYIDDVYVGPASRAVASRHPGTEFTSANQSAQNLQRVLTGYNVYRLLAADEATPANWIQVASGITDTTFTDTGWSGLADDTYKWAVRALYTNGLVSDDVISNSLIHLILASPANVVIVRNGANLQISWDAVVGATAYKVYGSDDPFAATPWSAPVSTVLAPNTNLVISSPAAAYKFYYVTATLAREATSTNPASIRPNGLQNNIIKKQTKR